MCGKAKSTNSTTRIDSIINRVINNVRNTVINSSVDTLEKNDNIVPGNMMFVAHMCEQDLHISQMKWGLKGFAGNFNRYTYNTRIESAIKIKKSKLNRAVIIIDGFYETTLINPDKPKTKKNTISNFITNDENLFIVPVLYNTYNDDSIHFTILTTQACDMWKDIHDRQPVILNEDTLKIWLDTSISNNDALHEI